MPKRQLIATALLAGLFGFAYFAVPAALALDPIVPDCARTVSDNPPDLDCVVTTFRGIAKLIVGVTGSAALLMFVYGGFTMITSAGASDKVKKGKTILTNAIIGLVLIFTAGYVVDYGVSKLTNGKGLQKPGASCNGGKGKIISTASGTVCSTPCAQMIGQGYTCMDPSLGNSCASENSQDCPKGEQCCVPNDTPPSP